ncbi:MAG TPA: TIM barrel protein, partial [Chloroflexota bacterium]|nr:TIM barrel protein [Chloroflexota bacterium]
VDDKELMLETRKRLNDTGLQVLDVEAIWVDASINVSDYERLFEAAASLGARYAVAMIHDPDETHGTGSFAALCELAAPYGVTVNLELAKYSAVTSIDQAARVVHSCASRNAAVLIDTLHFARAGGAASDIRAHRESLAQYIQIADAPKTPPADVSLYRDEALNWRLDPGAGDLPLAEMLGILPADTPLSVESPNRKLDHLSAVERARCALQETRGLIASVAEEAV